MDDFDAVRKRLRACYPNLDDQHSSPSAGSSSRGLPTLESQSYLAMSPAVAPTGSNLPSERKGSTLVSTTPSDGKRKAMEVVDLTEESDATAPLPKLLGAGGAIDLTKDVETPAPFLMAGTPPKNRSARDVAYRAKKARMRNHPLPALQHSRSYSAVQGNPSSFQVKSQQLYSNPSPSSDSRPHSDTQRYSNTQQISHPHQRAYTQQSEVPQSFSHPNVLLPQGFGKTDAAQMTGIPRRNDRLDLKPGAQSNPEHSAPTYGPVDSDVHNSIDPRQSMSEDNIETAHATQLQYHLEQSYRSAAVTLPDSVNGAQKQAEPGFDPLDPQAARALLQSWAVNARKVPCSGCYNPMLANKVNLNLLFKRWLESPTMNISSVVSCQTHGYSANTCLGCGSRHRTTRSKVPVPNKDASQLQWCCDDGRMVLLWILLCGIDRQKTARRRRGDYFKKPSRSFNVSGAGVGYGLHTSYGSGAPQAVNFGIYGQLDNSRVSIAQSIAPAAEMAEDNYTSKVMACLGILLPSPTAEEASSFDLKPPAHLLPVLLALLTQSSILGTIAALLRNDSLEDVTKRIWLYSNAFDVVDKLSTHPATNFTVSQARHEDSNPSDILDLSYSAYNRINNDKYEETDSIASFLHNLDKASKSLLTRAKIHPKDFAGGDSVQMLSLCDRVSQMADLIFARNAERSPSVHDQPGNAPHVRTNDWQSELAVLEIPDDVIMTRHTYVSQAAGASNFASGRMKSLSIQLSNLTTSVPPGVFVRYCASRIDVMKILIIGPKGTPYENGLFEFDLFCPAQFPNVPPKMQFRTTGGGRVRFNPNLYNDGKVCLSLLGTWTGPTWQPGKSTILQILVSIQAMVFCDEPWYNEPGRSSNAAASKAHNQELQGHTVRHAMLDWLKPGVDSVWADVVQKHFEASAGIIELTASAWGVDARTQLELREALRGKTGGRILGV